MSFASKLTTWYQKHHRQLPFREDQDPYKIWVSEIMAQQTQIATMIPYYEKWILKYPDVYALADAKIEEILKMWEGLGYYNRARNLHKGAQFVVDHFDGKLPADKKELMKIPGIGEYTSSAIASIAFNLPEVVIDGNVKRVMARYLNYEDNVNAVKAHRTFESYLKKELLDSQSDPNQFNQAIMELGALVCKPALANCFKCPLNETCAYAQGKANKDLPYIPKAKPIASHKKTVYIVLKQDKILISQDDHDGLMKGLYRLPMIDGHKTAKPDFKLIHKFSHLEWNINAYIRDDLEYNNDSWFWVEIPELVATYPMVTAHKKILQELDII